MALPKSSGGWFGGARSRTLSAYHAYGALMQVELSNREAALVLAALRNWQEEAQTTNLEDLFEAYFENEDPLENEQIDALCRRIVAAATAK